MLGKLQILPGAVAEILANSSETGTLTLADRYGLMAAIADESLEEDERRAINRLLRRVQRGCIQLT
ncbi:MAG: hypothetical protein HC910_20935 [Spirulinaceae cyanobacterium SM2_1_0]|nr:hypothetical protein [Spirulinaceae cyanobacterium SM2_1_0]